MNRMKKSKSKTYQFELIQVPRTHYIRKQKQRWKIEGESERKHAVLYSSYFFGDIVQQECFW